MADTIRGTFPNKCRDCGFKGCGFLHNGELVPKGTTGYFCGECWMARNVDFDETGVAKPLGTVWRLVPEEFADKAITVQTKSGAVYTLGKPIRETNCLVTPLQKQLGLHGPVQKQGVELPFDYAAIMLLRINEPMLLVYFNDEELKKLKRLKATKNIWAKAKVWHTTPVVSIGYSENGASVTFTRPKGLREAMKNLFA